MANITYRISSTEANPASITIKGSPLTNLEMDANIKSLNDNKAEISGTNATGTWPVSVTGSAGSAASLTTPRLINGVSFNGTADISVPLTNAATFNSSGSGAAAGSTFTGSGVITVSYNTLGAAPTADPTFTGNVTLPVTTAIGTVSSTEIGYLDGVTSSIQTQLANKVTLTASDKSAIIPTGATGSRDASPAAGYFRFNTSVGKFEGYNGTVWGSVGGGATGGGADDAFVENTQVITTSYTIPVGRNAVSTGPMTINSGAEVTVSTGSRWVVL